MVDDSKILELKASIGDLTQRLGVLEKTQLRSATVQAIAVVLLEKMQTRLKPADKEAIRFAEQRMIDGQSLQGRIDAVLAETPLEREQRRDTPRKRPV